MSRDWRSVVLDVALLASLGAILLNRLAAWGGPSPGLLSGGKKGEAIVFLEEPSQLARFSFGGKDPRTILIVLELGKAYLSVQNYPRARAVLVDAVTLGAQRPAVWLKAQRFPVTRRIYRLARLGRSVDRI